MKSGNIVQWEWIIRAPMDRLTSLTTFFRVVDSERVFSGRPQAQNVGDDGEQLRPGGLQFTIALLHTDSADARRVRQSEIYDLTAPAVMPSIKWRCSSTKINTTGSTMVTAAASISPQSVEYCPVRL
jgi:hypothetical protein